MTDSVAMVLAVVYTIMFGGGVLTTVIALIRMQRAADPLLAKVGIRRLDGGPRCIVGVTRLAFTSAGEHLAPRVRLAMQIAVLSGPISSALAMWLSSSSAS